jgi:hypothetical protein
MNINKEAGPNKSKNAYTTFIRPASFFFAIRDEFSLRMFPKRYRLRVLQ